MNVLLIAEEAAGIQALRLVARSAHRLVGVVTGPAGQEQRGATVAGTAAHLGVESWPAAEARGADLFDRIVERDVEILLNVHSLHVLDAAVVEAPAVGSFNLHPGPLPEYAGLNAPSWAIARGEREHGVTLHWMAADVDAGPIAYSERCEISPRETGFSLSAQCVRLGIPLIARLLDQAARDAGGIPREPQDLARRRWFEAGPPYSGRLPWSLTAREIVDLVRAADYAPFESPWGEPGARLGDHEISVLKASRTGRPAHAAPGSAGAIEDGARLVAASDEWVAVDRVRVDGGPPSSGAVLPDGRFHLEDAQALAKGEEPG